MLIPNLRMRGSDYMRKYSQGINDILIKEEIEADLEMARQWKQSLTMIFFFLIFL